MAMALKKTFDYQTKIFLVVNVFLWILVFVFVSIQYSREREYKVGMLNSKLQAYNEILLHEYAVKGKVDDALIKDCIHDEDVRVTLLNIDGNVLFDNSVEKLGNHKDRQEIVKAIKDGQGYTVRRVSASTNQDYFYSATKGNGVVMRTALPYDVNLVKILQGELEYIWVILGIAVIINVLLYFAIGRVGNEVKKLKKFAELAEKGDIENYDTSVFSGDELGEVSSVIVKM